MARRYSIQKQMVLDALQVLDHPTARDVVAEIKKTYPHISLGTVYRNLNLLVEDGIVRRLIFPDSPERFDIQTYDHYHLRCINCGTIVNIDGAYCDDIDARIASKTGLVIESHAIFFSGLCLTCQQKIKEKNKRREKNDG